MVVIVGRKAMLFVDNYKLRTKQLEKFLKNTRTHFQGNYPTIGDHLPVLEATKGVRDQSNVPCNKHVKSTFKLNRGSIRGNYLHIDRLLAQRHNNDDNL